jgi:hypothetical protein
VDATHYDFQLRQRLTSTALNVQTAWASRLAPEVLRALVAADAATVSGVLDGLLVTTQAGTLNIQIGGGLALLYDATQAAPASKHRWIEVAPGSPITATHDAGDVGNPRWDVVEIAPGNVDGAGEVLDFYNPNTGAFVPAVSAPLKVCTPTVTIRKGTAAANPTFPAGLAGRIPLAYVYVPTGAASILSTDILYCRPKVRPMTEEVGPGAYSATDGIGRTQRVQGGGLTVAAAGTSGTITNTLSGYFSRSGQRFIVPAGTGVRLSANNCDGGLPVANATLYFYAVPPSAVYPTGYGVEMAEREFIIPTASRIATGGYASGQYHCFVVASTKQPDVTQRGNPLTTSTFEITHPTIGTISIDTDKAVYIGCAYYNFAALQILAQVTDGPRVSTTRKTGYVFLEGALPIVNFVTSLANESTGEPDYALPAHVRRVLLTSLFALDIQGSFYFRWKDIHSDVVPGTKHRTGYRPAAMAEGSQGVAEWITLDASQTFTVVMLDVNGPDGSQYLGVSEFEDSILALR